MNEFNLARYSRLVDEELERSLPLGKEHPAIIHEAMRYSIFAGGKRLRPALALLTHETFGGDVKSIMPAAAALECIHTYSLIHDDLPAMDNDDYRRGKLTCHKVFGEAIAILAGDALLALGFELMARGSNQHFITTRVIQCLSELAQATGSSGLVGGQVVDIMSTSLDVTNEAATVDYIHVHKTGSLITSSVRIGAILAGASEQELGAVTRYAYYLGLGYQICDDILDAEGSSAALGKKAQKDHLANKLTYVSVYGIEGAI
ncbi:MAG: polyprenyl synthetase family protein, partial [bacterium]|nr:polyprenyl synthetase family protein [bacterium]